MLTATKAVNDENLQPFTAQHLCESVLLRSCQPIECCLGCAFCDLRHSRYSFGG